MGALQFGWLGVNAFGSATEESAPSEKMCVTPRDIYPPAAPKGLAAVASTGWIDLIWDPNTEADLAGYLVLRGVAHHRVEPADAVALEALAREGVRYLFIGKSGAILLGREYWASQQRRLRTL